MTGKIRISDNCVLELYSGADFYQYLYVKQKCLEYMCNNINIRNVFSFYTQSLKHSLKALYLQTKMYIFSHFDELAKAGEFNVLEYEPLLSVVTSSELQCRSESMVLDVVVDWLNGNDCKFHQKTMLMNSVRYGLMRSHELQDIIKHKSIFGEGFCKNIMSTVLAFHTEVNNQPLQSSLAFVPRGHRNFIIMGGMKKMKPNRFDDIIENVYSFDLVEGQIREVANLPSPRCCAVAVACGNYAFHIGGKSVQIGTKVKVEKTMYRYDVIANRWSKMQSINKARYKYHSESVNETN